MVVDPNAGLRASLVQILDQQQAQARVWGASVINAVAEAAVAYAPGRVVPKEAAPPLAPPADPRPRPLEGAGGARGGGPPACPARGPWLGPDGGRGAPGAPGRRLAARRGRSARAHRG